MNTLDNFLGGFKVWRRLRGGHWEYWAMSVPWTFQWFRMEGCAFEGKGEKPVGGYCAQPGCEDR